MYELIPHQAADVASLVDMTVATCPSEHTRRSYRTRLMQFMASGLPFNREGVAQYLQEHRESGKSTSTMVSMVAALRKLAEEARVRGLISRDEYDAIRTLSPGKHYRTRAGNWLTLEQVEAYLALPDRRTFWGRRDAALLSLMVGCGLRRQEMADLRWTSYQSRDGRMCLVDLKGKGNKRRTLPVPTWAIEDVDRWNHTCHSCLPPPVAFGSANRPTDFTYVMGGMSDESIYRTTRAYGSALGHNLAPHDLRRTLARLMRQSNAPLEQIQATLGHESIQTTTIYLGSSLELSRGKASVDLIPMGTSSHSTEDLPVDATPAPPPPGAPSGSAADESQQAVSARPLQGDPARPSGGDSDAA